MGKFKGNKYDLNEEYGIGYCSNTGTPFYFDLEDYDKIKEYTWRENVDRKGHKDVATLERISRKSIRLHHLIAGKNYDHIDRNAFNNRKNNLRPATHAENARNRPRQKNNTSGYTGVSWSKRYNKWIAQIWVSSNIVLGKFENKEDALIARLKAEKRYFG